MMPFLFLCCRSDDLHGREGIHSIYGHCSSSVISNKYYSRIRHRGHMPQVQGVLWQASTWRTRRLNIYRVNADSQMSSPN